MDLLFIILMCIIMGGFIGYKIGYAFGFSKCKQIDNNIIDELSKKYKIQK